MSRILRAEDMATRGGGGMCDGPAAGSGQRGDRDGHDMTYCMLIPRSRCNSETESPMKEWGIALSASSE